MSDNDNFTAEQRQFLEIVAGGATVRAAAQMSGIPRQTVHIWMRDTPGFHEAVAAAREQAIAQRKQKIAEASRVATEYLEGVIQDERIPHNLRIRASFALLKVNSSGSSLSSLPTRPSVSSHPSPALPSDDETSIFAQFTPKPVIH